MEQIFDEILKKKELENFYQILDCNEHSTQSQIAAEYRNKALECHPDKNPEDREAETRFLKLKSAYEVLGNEEERREYDAWRRSGIPVTYQTWKKYNRESQQALHWTPKEKSQQLITDSTEEQIQFKQRQQSDDSLINKFRNYEI